MKLFRIAESLSHAFRTILHYTDVSAKDAGWMIVETANVNGEDGIEKRQQVELELKLGASCVYDAKFVVYDLNGFDIVLGTKWMRDINR